MSWEWASQPITVPVWLVMTYGALWVIIVSRFITSAKRVKK